MRAFGRQGRPRHPVLLPKGVFQRLGHSTHQNLKEFLQSLSLAAALQESEDAGLDLDLVRHEVKVATLEETR